MENVFAAVIMGHLVGDYLLQPKAMALRKSEKSWTGFAICLIHCIIYTWILALFLWTTNSYVILSIFVIHFGIDRWSLASVWLKFIHGRNFVDAYTRNDQIDLAFSCLVYAVVDNTMHIVPVYFIAYHLIQ